MLTIEEYQALADLAAAHLPPGIFDELNGGVVISERVQHHPHSRPDAPLYVLGTYNVDQMGKYIILYYGSFRRVYPELTADNAEPEIRHILYHELTHHVEMLAGDKSLEKQDARDIAKYDARD